MQTTTIEKSVPCDLVPKVDGEVGFCPRLLTQNRGLCGQLDTTIDPPTFQCCNLAEMKLREVYFRYFCKAVLTLGPNTDTRFLFGSNLVSLIDNSGTTLWSVEGGKVSDKVSDFNDPPLFTSSLS